MIQKLAYYSLFIKLMIHIQVLFLLNLAESYLVLCFEVLFDKFITANDLYFNKIVCGLIRLSFNFYQIVDVSIKYLFFSNSIILRLEQTILVLVSPLISVFERENQKLYIFFY